MLFEELAELQSGDHINLDLYSLWQDKYGGTRNAQDLDYEGHLEMSVSDLEDDGDEEEAWEDPYIDLYTDNGPVACDGEESEVVDVDPDAETITLKSYDSYDGAPFTLSFDDASHCVRAA